MARCQKKNERMVQQQRDAERHLRAEASILAAQTCSQLHAEFRMLKYGTSAENDELHRIQIQFRKLERKSEDQVLRSITTSADCRIRVWKPNSSCESVESGRHRLHDQETQTGISSSTRADRYADVWFEVDLFRMW